MKRLYPNSATEIKPDEIRLRFFQDLTERERIKLFRVFDLLPYKHDPYNRAAEKLMLDRLLGAMMVVPSDRDHGWRVSITYDLENRPVMHILDPKGAATSLVSQTSKDSPVDLFLNEFARNFAGFKDAKFNNSEELADWLGQIHCATETGAVTSEPYEPAEKAAEVVRFIARGGPVPDWMRKAVFSEFKERLMLPDGDEARIGPVDTLIELVLAANLDQKSVWIANGRAYGRVSDEQIEVILTEALADVRKRSDLGRYDNPTITAEQVQKYIDAADDELGHECAESWVQNCRDVLRKAARGTDTSLSGVGVHPPLKPETNSAHYLHEAKTAILDLVQCDGSPANVSTAEVLAARVRSKAKDIMGLLTEINLVDNSWHQAMLDQCALIECGYNPNDPRATLQAIIKWHSELAAEDTVPAREIVALRDRLNELLTGKLSEMIVPGGIGLDTFDPTLADTNTVQVYTGRPPEQEAVINLIGNTDGQAWTAEFLRIFPQGCSDHGTMTAWFANAIMSGYDWGRAQERKEQPVWVPIAEGLPEKDGEYVITADTDSGRVVSSARLEKVIHGNDLTVSGKWVHEGEYTFQHGYYFRPIAWLDRLTPADCKNPDNEE